MIIELIDKAFHGLFDDELSIFITAGKVIALLIFGFTLGKKLFKSFSTSGMALSKDQEGLSPYDLVRGLVIVGAILSITQILSLFDSILILIENVAKIKWLAEITPGEMYNVEIAPPDTGSTIADMVLQNLRETKEMLSPGTWIMKGLYYVMYILDIIIFAVFIAKRYFFMGVIKIFSPIILGLSILPEYRQMSYNLGKVYLRNFLVIIPYILVAVFANRVHDAIVSGLLKQGGVIGSFTPLFESNARTIGLAAAVFIKLVLYKNCSDLMKELFS